MRASYGKMGSSADLAHDKKNYILRIKKIIIIRKKEKKLFTK
jgi:hypothetical protein